MKRFVCGDDFVRWDCVDVEMAFGQARFGTSFEADVDRCLLVNQQPRDPHVGVVAGTSKGI